MHWVGYLARQCSGRVSHNRRALSTGQPAGLMVGVSSAKGVQGHQPAVVQAPVRVPGIDWVALISVAWPLWGGAGEAAMGTALLLGLPAARRRSDSPSSSTVTARRGRQSRLNIPRQARWQP